MIPFLISSSSYSLGPAFFTRQILPVFTDLISPLPNNSYLPAPCDSHSALTASREAAVSSGSRNSSIGVVAPQDRKVQSPRLQPYSSSNSPTNLAKVSSSSPPGPSLSVGVLGILAARTASTGAFLICLSPPNCARDPARIKSMSNSARSIGAGGWSEGGSGCGSGSGWRFRALSR